MGSLEEIVHDADAYCFSAVIDGRQAGYLKYRMEDGTMVIFTTFVEPDMRGRGIASRMTDAAFAYAKEKGLKAAATCSYAAAQIK